MIAVQLQGQLCNQLFQIAFIRKAAGILKENYTILDDNSYGCLPDRYFRLRFLEKRIPRKILKKYFTFFPRATEEFSNWMKPDDMLNNLKKGVIYKGFFQSEIFLDGKDKNDSYRIRKKYWKLFYRKYGEIFRMNRIILIHIRLRDYFEIGTEELGGKGLQLPFGYYEAAMENIEVNDNTKVMVISDDPDLVREKLKLKVPFSIETNHYIIDLLLLMNAQVLVLSNSTFSWWGAYLNTVEGLKVYAPRYWLGFKVNKTYPAGIMRGSWTSLSVDD